MAYAVGNVILAITSIVFAIRIGCGGSFLRTCTKQVWKVNKIIEFNTFLSELFIGVRLITDLNYSIVQKQLINWFIRHWISDILMPSAWYIPVPSPVIRNWVVHFS